MTETAARDSLLLITGLCRESARSAHKPVRFLSNSWHNMFVPLISVLGVTHGCMLKFILSNQSLVAVPSYSFRPHLAEAVTISHGSWPQKKFAWLPQINTHFEMIIDLMYTLFITTTILVSPGVFFLWWMQTWKASKRLCLWSYYGAVFLGSFIVLYWYVLFACYGQILWSSHIALLAWCSLCHCGSYGRSLPVSTFMSELRKRQQRATTLLRMMPHTLHYLEVSLLPTLPWSLFLCSV